MSTNRFKEGLAEGRVQLGFRCALGSAPVAELLSHVGFAWITIDAEHSVVDLPLIVEMDRAMRAGTASTIVRLESHRPELIGRYLDCGIETLIVPGIDDASQARAIVEASRYPPEGTRGMAAAHRGNRYGQERGYLQGAAQRICLLMQIESVEGVAALDEILLVPGVDGIYVGPADLAASLGYTGQAQAQPVEAAIASIVERCRAARMPVGVMASTEADAKRRIAQGFTFVALGTDTTALRDAARAALERTAGAS
jgi:2-keto-3-deoxy-L-rhamnonate aldolase RhmA